MRGLPVETEANFVAAFYDEMTELEKMVFHSQMGGYVLGGDHFFSVNDVDGTDPRMVAGRNVMHGLLGLSMYYQVDRGS